MRKMYSCILKKRLKGTCQFKMHVSMLARSEDDNSSEHTICLATCFPSVVLCPDSMQEHVEGLALLHAPYCSRQAMKG